MLNWFFDGIVKRLGPKASVRIARVGMIAAFIVAVVYQAYSTIILGDWITPAPVLIFTIIVGGGTLYIGSSSSSKPVD